MRTLIFADTHLGKRFEEKKFKFLESIIADVDQVIINGDFWEGVGNSFEDFINSPWRHLFPLLKNKKTIYIFGNHDEKKLTNSKVNLFSHQQTDRYELKSNGSVFICEHGNRLISFTNDSDFPKSVLVSKTLDSIEKLMIKVFNKKVFEFICRRFNKVIKKKIKQELLPNQYFVCSHTHVAEVDKNNRFINTGLIKHGLGQYIPIDEGKIDFHEEWYD